MARTLPGAIWEFLRYEFTSRRRGDLVLTYRAPSLDDEQLRGLNKEFRDAFPQCTRWVGSGDGHGSWSIEAHIAHAGEPETLRRQLAAWMAAHQPPLADYSIAQRSFRGTV